MIELVHILFYVFSPDDPCDFEKLIVVVLSFEERLFSKHHPCEHAACRPNVKLIVVVMVSKE